MWLNFFKKTSYCIEYMLTCFYCTLVLLDVPSPAAVFKHRVNPCCSLHNCIWSFLSSYHIAALYKYILSDHVTCSRYITITATRLNNTRLLITISSINTTKFHQHVSCPTRGDKTLDHVHTNMADAYKAVPLPHLGQSDHLSLFLLPKYTPLIKRVTPTVRTVKVWPEGADSALQHRFGRTDWSVFATQATLDSHTDINAYASSVLDFINTNINSVTTLKQITTFPNQKPWMNREVRLLLKARDTAFRSGDTQAYSSS